MLLLNRRAAIFTFTALCIALCGLTSVAKDLPASRIVDVAASDGVNLKATYFAAARPGPGILLLHQCDRQRKDWDDLAGRLAKSGFNVLTLDFRGFGDSGGTPPDQLTPQDAAQIEAEKWPGDADAAFRYLASQPGVSGDLIGAGGASCAVNLVVGLAQRHPEVKSLLLLSEATDRDGRQFLRNNPRMPLFLAVADDDPDPGVVELMQWLASLSSNPLTSLERFSSGGHGVEMFAAHKDLPSAIADWFGQALRPSSVVPTSQSRKYASVESHLLDLTDRPGGGEEALRILADAHRHDPRAVLFSEAVINRMGYEHLHSGDAQGAVDIFKLNAEAYPDSPNVYDSLSDAYLAAGRKNQARASAKIALVLLTSDTTDSIELRDAIKASCEKKLKQLGDAPQKPPDLT